MNSTIHTQKLNVIAGEKAYPNRVCICAALLLLIVYLPALSYGQYFSTLHDFDSSGDAGVSLFRNANGTLQVWNVGANRQGGQSIGAMNIGDDGIRLNSQSGLDFGSTLISFCGFGRVKKLNDQNYYSAINIFGYAPISARPFGISGFAKFNQIGDTLLLKRYTDSSNYLENPVDCIRMSGGRYLLGGARRTNLRNALDSALLRCIDSNGNELWVRTYQKTPGTYASFNILEWLSDGYILAGAECLSHAFKTYPPDPNPFDYYRRIPWFMILDTFGNIVRDRIYSDTSQHLIGSGRIFSDRNGGYFHVGVLDSFFMPSPNYEENQPNYLAHLNSNFQFLWRTDFADTQGKKFINNVRQLQDLSYLVIGALGNTGWMAKVDKRGNIVWDHHYVIDSLQRGYLADAIELPNGNIVASGSNSSTSLPVWHGDDVWLLEVDGNGCEVLGCSSGVGIPAIHRKDQQFLLYPNPTTSGAFTASVSEAGKLSIFDAVGHLIIRRIIESGATNLQLPDELNTKFLFVRYTTATGNFSSTIKLVNRR